jgi:hypothetical protein
MAVLRFALARARGRLGELEPVLRAAVERFPTLAAFRASLALACVESGREVEARAQLEHLAADGFTHVPRDGAWLAAMCHLALVCAVLDDPERAAVVYDLLLPYADRVAVVSLAHGCEGAVAHFLGLLASTLGRAVDAERHFEQALARNTALGSPSLVAETERARQAMRDARDANGEAATGAAAARNVFRLEGEVWTVVFAGHAIRLRDTKGLGYIAHLLARPGREIHVADLAGAGDLTPHTAAARDPGRPDARARTAYRTRLESLREEIDTAERINDVMRAERLRTEMEQLAAELARIYGLHGHRRASDDPVEKLRKAVTNRIREALTRIRKADPALGRHLGRSIHTGVFCVYRPDEPVGWEL